VWVVLAHPARLAEAYRRRLHEPTQTKHQEQHILDTQLGKVQPGLARLIDRDAEGLIAPQACAPRITRLRQRITQLEEQRQRLADAASVQTELRLIIGRLEDCAARVRTGLETADWLSQRELIRALVKRVEVAQDLVHVVFRVDQAPVAPRLEKKSLQDCRGSEDPSLRGTFLCWHEGFLIYNSCLEPLPYGSGKEGTCSHFFQERRLLDFVEAAGDICVQHVSWL
jgi:site-specific DNA recombinase